MALIVLMEDDAATRMLVSSVLKKDGHEVLAAEDDDSSPRGIVTCSKVGSAHGRDTSQSLPCPPNTVPRPGVAERRFASCAPK